jgi:serine/threonine protein kinase
MLSGGRLFDEGGYGCIFTPPLLCKNKKSNASLDDTSFMPISKLLLKEYADIEYSIAEFIHKIPLWKNYFLVSESICEPAAASQQTESELKDCDLLENHKLSEFRLLTMPFGGIPLLLFKFQLRNFDFMSFISHFIEAIALLNLFGVVHRDLHQGNILVDQNNVPRIIDFNLAIRVHVKIAPNLLRHQHNPNIGQEPPDSVLVNAIYYGYDPQKVIDSIVSKKTIIKKVSNILEVPLPTMHEQLEQFLEQSKSVKAGDDITWFQTYWRTIDSWAVGINIIDMISKLILWPEFLPTYRQIKPKLLPVLRRLCAVSPVERIDCIQALKYLHPNSFIIRKYGKAWLDKVGTGNIQ